MVVVCAARALRKGRRATTGVARNGGRSPDPCPTPSVPPVRFPSPFSSSRSPLSAQSNGRSVAAASDNDARSAWAIVVTRWLRADDGRPGHYLNPADRRRYSLSSVPSNKNGPPVTHPNLLVLFTGGSEGLYRRRRPRVLAGRAAMLSVVRGGPTVRGIVALWCWSAVDADQSVRPAGGQRR